MQADTIPSHLGTASATTTTYEYYVEIIRTFCQTINHANRKAAQDKSRRKALQAEFQQSQGCGRSERSDRRTSGRSDGQGIGGTTGPGHSRQSGRTGGHGGGNYHNWIPREQFDSLDDEGYNRLIRDRIARGEIQGNNADTDTNPGTQVNTASTPITQVQTCVNRSTCETET